VRNNFATYVGARIVAARTRLGLTQRALAADAGLSVSFLSDVENGKRSVSLANAVKIAGALGVPLSLLVPRPGDTR
jgi:transcriptional regulator with XRE-family HTH domain